MERETLQKELIGLFEETAGCKFNKKHYASDMADMMEKHGEFLRELVQMCEESEDTLEAAVSCVPENDFAQAEQVR